MGYGGANFSVSQTGTLVYQGGKTARSSFPVVWIDSSGKAAPLIPKPDVYLTPRLSPDGRSLAIAFSSSDLHVWDIPRQTLTRVAFNQQNNLHPVWTADSRYIVYTSESNGVFAIWWGGPMARASPTSSWRPKPSWWPVRSRRTAASSPTINLLLERQTNIWTLPLDLSDPENPKPGAPEPFLRRPAGEANPAFSPDGHWIAYSSGETGHFEIYVRPSRPDPANGRSLATAATGPGLRAMASSCFTRLQMPTSWWSIIRSESFVAGNP